MDWSARKSADSEVIALLGALAELSTQSSEGDLSAEQYRAALREVQAGPDAHIPSVRGH